MLEIKDHYVNPILDEMAYHEILVDNRGNSSELADYQVSFAIDEKQMFFEAQDGLRFVDENLEIVDHWSEAFPSIEWIKTTKIPGSGICAFRMLDGNPSLNSASNGDGTFLFFDDFEDNLDQWTIYTGSTTMVLSSTYSHHGIYSAKKEPGDSDFMYHDLGAARSDEAIRVWFYDVNAAVEEAGVIGIITPNVIFVGIYDVEFSGKYVFRLNTTWYDSGISRSAGWHRVDITFEGSATEAFIDGVELFSVGASTFESIVMGGSWYSGTNGFFVDDYITRKYTLPEPTAEIGAMI